jgi:hypothetical protein
MLKETSPALHTRRCPVDLSGNAALTVSGNRKLYPRAAGLDIRSCFRRAFRRVCAARPLAADSSEQHRTIQPNRGV